MEIMQNKCKKSMSLLIMFVFVLAISACSKNTETALVQGAKLPTSIDKVNLNLKEDILCLPNLEDDLNFRRIDRNSPLYIKVIENAEIEIYKEPGNIDSTNRKGKYKNISLGEVGDKKTFDGEDWYFLRVIYPISLEEKKKLTINKNYDKKLFYRPPQNGWIKESDRIVIDPNYGPVYSLSNSQKMPAFIKGNWRFAYTEFEDNNHQSYYIDVNSINKKEEKIYFNALKIDKKMSFIWSSEQKKYYYEFPDNCTEYYINKFCYDTKNNYIYLAAYTRYSETGSLLSNNDYEKQWEEHEKELENDKEYQKHKKAMENAGMKYPKYNPFDRGQYLCKDEHTKLVYEESTREPVFDKFPNLLYTAFFEILEGR